MLTVGELVICCAILMIALMAMLVVFIKNAVEQNTNVPNLILSMFSIRTIRGIFRKTAKVQKKETNDAAGERLKTGAMEEGQEMVSKDAKEKNETGAKAKKGAPGFLADLASTMFLWQPSKLLAGRKDKFAEQSKQIDSELDKLLAENIAEEESSPDSLYTPENAQLGIPDDVMKKARAIREARQKGLFKNDETAGQPEAEKKEPAALDKEVPAMAIKVEKLEIKEGMAPKWDAIIPHKDPAMIAQDAVMLESKIMEPAAVDHAKPNTMETPKEDAGTRLKINDMPVWGHTGLGKPLAEFKSANPVAATASEPLPGGLPDKNEVEKMIKQNNDKPANPMPAIAPPVKVEPIKPAAAPKAESKNQPLNMDFADSLLKELEEEHKDEDDGSLDIMGDLKGKKIDADELEFDAMDVLSMIRTNVKNNKQKGKPKPKPKARQ